MSDGALESLTANLADNIRYIRERRNLTQSQLSKLCGVPRSTVGNIETGESNPTLSVLSRLAASLQLSLEELLTAPRVRCQLFPKGTLPTLKRGRGGKCLVQKLFPHPIPGMEIDRLVLPGGERITGVPHRPGTHECLYCERGALSLWVSGEKFELGEGDVATFPGDQAHSYHNAGRRTAVGFCVVTLAPMQEMLVR